MRPTLSLAGWALAAGLCAAAAQATDAPAFSAADVFQLQYASDPLVDSKGGRLLYLRHTMDIMKDRSVANLWLVDIDSGEQRPVTTGPQSVGGAALSPDDGSVAYIAQDDVGAQLFVTWLDIPRTAQLTRLPQTPGDITWSPDGRWLAFAMRVPVDAPGMGTLPKKPEGAQWADPPVVVDRTVYRNDGAGMRPHGFVQVFVMPASGGSPRQLTSGDFDHNGGIAWAADGKSLYISANRHPDWALDTQNSEIYRVDVASGELVALTDRQGPDDNPQVSPNGRQIAYLGYDDRYLGFQQRHLYVMDSKGGGKRDLLPDFDRNVAAPQWSPDGKRIYFLYDDHGQTVLAATDLDGSITVLARNLGGISPSRPYTGANYAVGGKGVYAFTSDSTAAPADISVGQRGRNRQLTRLNDNLLDNNYPSQDYDDLMSAVDAVIGKGYINPDQLYVTGGSGGGTLTAWIVGSTDRFRAAAVAKPVINWTSFVLTSDVPPYFTRYWFRSMPWEDHETYWRRSPLSKVGNVSTPTMLLTGESDLRTPISETEQFYEALKLRGVDTAMVRMPGASHSIYHRPSQMIGKAAAILEWFRRHAG